MSSALLSSPRRLILRSGGWLIARQIANLANSLVIAIFVARHLGPEGYGILSYAVSLVAIVAPLTTLGMRNLSLREYKMHPEDSNAIVGTVTIIRLVGSLVSVLIVFLVAWLYPIAHPDIAILCTLLAGAALLKSIDTIQEYFIARQDPKPFVIFAVANMTLFAGIKIALVFLDATVDAFIVTLAVQGAMSALGGVIAYRRHTRGLPRFRFEAARAKRYLAQGFPLMLGSLSAVIYLKSDILMLSYLAGKETTGLYAVAARLSEIWYVLPTAFATALFPRMVELRDLSPARYAARVQDAMDSFAAFGTLIAVSSLFWAAPVVAVLFGDGYAGSVSVLYIYAWVGIVFATRALMHKWLLVEGVFWGSAMIHATGAVANVLLNLLLIPRYGAEGAAIATVASYALAPILLAPLVPSLRRPAVMQLKAILWPRRVWDLRPGGRT
ncbi:Polysaccharide biosynthesis protein [Oceanicola granulosus HTCC2516]|uniref:Polysaccharide biosynthesis protein n=1 Tax=Oceanicola granulosus (strain ATCC BAA-861 / DSM 15982 / KCTC 12143 / HTCC2516) TaxID=314256 RepID=Q2CES0_OCEGH|nr:flippase [Oceanicola granulosus]EAR51188.1 Polysaccharide biosynthesis protein [Oceanicola granulosus HTCC2516]